MPDKVITLDFDFQNSLNKHKTIWSYLYGKQLKGYLTHTAAAAMMFLFGLWIDQFALLPWCTMAGVVYIIYIAYMWRKLFRQKKQYMDAVLKIAHRYESEKIKCTYTFSDSNIEYYDKERTFRLA